MDLSEFVRDTLIQICDGVAQAQRRERDFDSIVNPHQFGKAITPTAASGRPITEVQFDVAVTTESTSGGSARISVWSIGGGVEGAARDSVVSRIRFSVPLALPGQRSAGA